MVNDNGRSYAPTIGGLADRLATLRLQPGYERVLEAGKQALARARPWSAARSTPGLHALKAGVKDALSPQELFSDLGLKYFGPVDGHDIAAMESALRRARHFGGPVIVHAVTRKGSGYPPAENDEAEQMHSPAAFDPETGLPTGPPSVGWTSVFAEEMVALGARRPDVVAITAAMLGPTGLAPFAEAFPERCFDVGIAEQHALTSAAGLAMGGLHPVVALYSTFLNRAFDQLLMDVALHGKARHAGAGPGRGHRQRRAVAQRHVGPVAARRSCPGMRVAAPRDAATLREELAEAVAVDDGPTAIRFPKGAVIESVPARAPASAASTCCTSPAGTDAVACCWCAPGRSASWASRRRSGWSSRASPSPWSTRAGCCRCPRCSSSWPAATGSSSRSPTAAGTAGSAPRWPTRCATAECDVPLRDLAIPQRFLDHGSRADVLAAAGLTAQDVARRVTEWAAALSGRPGPSGSDADRSRARGSRHADAGAGRRGRAAAGRRRRARAAPRGHGRRRRLRRRQRPREVA